MCKEGVTYNVKVTGPDVRFLRRYYFGPCVRFLRLLCDFFLFLGHV